MSSDLCSQTEGNGDLWVFEGGRVFFLEINGHRCFGINVYSETIDDDMWKKMKRRIVTELTDIYEKGIKYHFIFDLHSVPVQRLPSFMRLMTKYQYILNECLYSTAMVTQSKLLHSALQIAMQLYTPARPINFFYREHTDNTPSEEIPTIPLRVMNQVKEFYAKTH